MRLDSNCNFVIVITPHRNNVIIEDRDTVLIRNEGFPIPPAGFRLHFPEKSVVYAPSMPQVARLSKRRVAVVRQLDKSDIHAIIGTRNIAHA